MHDNTCMYVGAAMVNSEESRTIGTSGEDESDDQPRDLQELLLWHKELSSRPYRESQNPQDRTLLWKRFQEETERLAPNFKWNQMIRQFTSFILEKGNLDSGIWHHSHRWHELICCPAERQIVSSGMTLQSITLDRVHKSLKYTTRLGHEGYIVNYRVQPPILDHLPIPRTLIDSLKKLWKNCERHRNMCGHVSLRPHRRFLILKCTHEPEKNRVGESTCKKPECQLYKRLFNKGAWRDWFSIGPNKWSNLTQGVADSLGIPRLQAGTLLTDAEQGHGVQSFRFSV